MLKTMTKKLRGVGALLLAALLALSVVPLATTYAAEPAAGGGGDPAANANGQYTVTVDQTGLHKATVTIDKTTVSPGEWVRVTITRDQYTNWVGDPHVTATNGTIENFGGGGGPSYGCNIVDITGDVVITVTGRAVGYSANLDATGLTHATAALSKTEDIVRDEPVTLTITPEPGYGFVEAPTVTKNKTFITVGPLVPQIDGSYTSEIKFKVNGTITVTGEAVSVSYNATLNATGLTGAGASLSKESGIAASDKVILTIVPEAGKSFATAPAVTADGATAGQVAAGADGSYTCELSSFTKNAVVTVTGQAEEVTYTATLDKSRLVNADATLSKMAGIKANESVNLTVTPEAGKSFAKAPVVVATNATVGQPTVQNGTYTFSLTGFTGDAAITVTGEAEAAGYTATLDKSRLVNADAALSKAVGIKANETVTLTITPAANRAFDAAPVVSADGATAGQVTAGANGTYTCELTAFTKNATITVTGRADATAYTATLDAKGLKGATAALSKTAGIKAGEKVTLTIAPAANHAFAAAPVVSADGATAGKVVAGANGTYVCELTAFTKNAAVTVTGQANEVTYLATLDAKGLAGATAQLSAVSGIKAGDTVMLTVTPEAGRSFAKAPAVAATNATVGQPTVQNGAYVFPLTGFTGDATVTVTGEAKVDIRVDGNGTHLVGAGGTLTFTCSLPLEDLVRVLVDGKELDKSNYDAKSGSTIITLKAAYLDTLAEGRHTIQLAYTGDRAASLGFEVVKAKPVPTDDKGGSKIAKTGDPLDAAPLAGAAAVAAALMGAAALRRKRDAE